MVLVTPHDTAKIILEPGRVCMYPTVSLARVDKGIVLAGGGALLKGMDVFLREETSLPIIIAEDPLTCVALGAGKVLDDEDILKKVMM